MTSSSHLSPYKSKATLLAMVLAVSSLLVFAATTQIHLDGETGALLTALALSLSLSVWLQIRLSRQKRRFFEEIGGENEISHRLEAMINAAPIAIVYIDRGLKYIFCNSHYREHYGRGNVVGLAVRDVLGPDSYEIVKPCLLKALSGEIATLETPIWRTGRPPLHVKAVYAPSFDVDGRVEGVVAISEDITARKEAELQLKQSRDNLDFALQSGRMGTWEVDLENQKISCSQEMLDLWGVSRDEFYGGRSILQTKVHPEDLDKMKRAMDVAIQNGAIYELAYRIQPSVGVERWVLSRGRCSYAADTNKPVRFSGVVYDITENKRVEAELKESKDIAERANRAKTQFLANMSHEIRTPIGAIIGFTQMLKGGSNSPAETAQFMGIIERNSQNLLRLIDDILDLSKVEAGKITLEKSTFSFTDFLADFSSVMNLRAVDKNIGFTLKLDGRIPNQINTDPLRLRQILSNLVGNAIKFTEQGQVEMTVKYEAPSLIFTVRDTGPGIPRENIGQLFRSFGQADPSLTRKYGGSGLGLLLAKRLSEALGGDAILEQTEINKGSTFIAKIEVGGVIQSRMIGLDARLTNGESMETKERSQLSGLFVLLVEDSPDNRILISTYLRHTGAVVEVAEDGLSGFNKAMDLRPDVILMDVQMPVMDGHTATRKLRQVGFAKPIVALTAHAMREERDKCFQSGCTDFLTKPIQRGQLVEVLSRYSPR